MQRRLPARRRGAGVVLAGLTCLVVAACSAGEGAAGNSADEVASTDRDASPGAAPKASGGTASAEPTSPDPDPRATSPKRHQQAEQPLVIAVHHTSALRDLSLARARRIVDGDSNLAMASGPPTTALQSVVHGRQRVAIVPASALGPQVRAVRVEGVDPVRRPAAYPLRTEAAAAPGRVTTVTVVGDIMLGRGVAEAARGTADPVAALRPTAARLRRADITVGNLESTLSRAGAPTQGDDSFAADPQVAQGLRGAGFDVLSLANNHAGDYGGRALVQTVRRLRAAGLQTFGAGRTVRQAWKPVVVNRGGVSFGFMGFNAIGETPEAAPGRPGAVSVSMPPRTGPLDRAELRAFERALGRLDRRVDVVVALPHWGTQYTNRPEPIQRLVARRLVAAGADVVVGGHPHWLQAVELVSGRFVAHSLGNFVFDMDFMRRTMEGAFVELVFWDGELKAAELVPYVMGGRFAPRVVTGPRARQVLATMRETSGAAFR